MQRSYTFLPATDARRDERGAALISVLLISTLLLAGGAALVLTTSMQATTAISSTAEVQAYYAAEAGLQAAINVIRGNVAPVAGSGIPAGTMSGNFQSAVIASTSNKSADPMSTQTTPVYRLSAWLNYTYPSTLTSSNALATANRVPLNILGSSYDPLTDTAFRVEVKDPDNTAVGTEPTRLIISSTGYGPRGSVKVLQMMLNKTAFSVDPPATITLRGSEDGSALTFDSGSSNAKTYSGVDYHGGNPTGAQADRPSFATTGSYIGALNSGISKPGTVTPQVSSNPLLGILDVQTSGVPASGVSTSVVPTPSILQSADNARAAVESLRLIAQDLDVYSANGFSGTVGSSSAPAFKFVDGNVNLDGGAGFLVVTGTLTMSGNPDFEGLILVLGAGVVTRNGGGNGQISGAIMIAKFDSTGGFKGPTFNTNGGGNSDVRFDSEAIRRALNATGRPVLGVVER